MTQTIKPSVLSIILADQTDNKYTYYQNNLHKPKMNNNRLLGKV